MSNWPTAMPRPPDPVPEPLVALRGKYAEMLAMRLAQRRGDEDAADVRARMALLAARFPGALREIDDLDLGEIYSRIDDLDRALRGEIGPAPWMVAVARFHALARGALAAKRWLGGRKQVDEATLRAYVADLSALSGESAVEAEPWTAELHLVAAPPRGRLMDVVFDRLARSLDANEDDARRLVFGVPRRDRARRAL